LTNTAVLVTLQDAWLSAFTDAEGCINISIIAYVRYAWGHVIKRSYILDQKENTTLLIIQNLFGFGKVTIRTKTDGIYRYTATGVKCMKNVISYFKVLPLLTKKAQSFEK